VVNPMSQDPTGAEAPKLFPVCCDIVAEDGWSYCPGCGEDIDWPPTPKQIAEREERERQHAFKMETDPEYKRRHETRIRFLKLNWDNHVEAYCRDVDPFAQASK
jgi:hypothetical protein